jgi:hypothetical protein
MTKEEQVAQICYKFSALASMDASNLERRIKRLALGKSDPAKLAAALLKVKRDGQVSPDAAEDEQIWAAAMLALAPAPAPKPALTPAPKSAPQPQPKPAKNPDAE